MPCSGPTRPALHDYFEASALAYADRGAYVGDPRACDRAVLDELLSQPFADERFCRMDQTAAAVKPVPAGTPDGSYDTNCDDIPDTTVAPRTTRACPPRTSRSPTGGATSSPTR